MESHKKTKTTNGGKITSHERKLIRKAAEYNIHGVRSGASKWACDNILFKSNKFLLIENKATASQTYRPSKEQFQKMLNFAKEGSIVYYAIYFKNKLKPLPKWKCFQILPSSSPFPMKYEEGELLEEMFKNLK